MTKIERRAAIVDGVVKQYRQHFIDAHPEFFLFEATKRLKAASLLNEMSLEAYILLADKVTRIVFTGRGIEEHPWPIGMAMIDFLIEMKSVKTSPQKERGRIAHIGFGPNDGWGIICFNSDKKEIAMLKRLAKDQGYSAGFLDGWNDMAPL